MLLSKHPLTNKKSAELYSVDLPRAYLYAEANLPDWGDIAITCIHLTALPYQGAPYLTPLGTNFTSYQQESLYQLNSALSAINAPGTPANKILMGDHNSSPSVAALAITPTLIQTIDTILNNTAWHSQSLLNSGLQPRDICTWCRDNINAEIGPDGAINQVLDWIHYQGLAAKSGETLVDIVEREVDYILPDGTMVSDHYSVKWTRATAPTCSDGVMNGDEQGVDCGGSSCSACIAKDNCPSAPAPTPCAGNFVQATVLMLATYLMLILLL